MVSGLALYSYTAGRLIVIVALVFLATLLGRGRTRRVWRLTGFYLLGVGAAAAPLLLNYIKTPSVLELPAASNALACQVWLPLSASLNDQPVL